jgi:hypothetical protein
VNTRPSDPWQFHQDLSVFRTVCLSHHALDSAGTASEKARETVEKLLLETLSCRKILAEMKAMVSGFAIDAIIVERMVALCAMSLGCIMSGMGDLRTFKLLRCDSVPWSLKSQYVLK